MPKKIIFMGTPLFAVPILKSLYQNGYPISVVYTQPPQKSQRGQKINKSPIQGISETLNIDFKCPENFHNQEEYEFTEVRVRSKSGGVRSKSFGVNGTPRITKHGWNSSLGSPSVSSVPPHALGV